MAFTVPNKADAAFADQAKLDNVDLDIIALGFARTGVVSGCTVSAQGAPDTTVAVAAGLAIINGVIVPVAAGSVSGFTGDATHPRFDLVTVDSAGAKARVAGTAAANPAFPEVPADRACLAAVYVPQSDTTIAANQITDKRVTVSANGAVLATKTSTTTVVNTAVETTVFSATIPGGLLATGDRVIMDLQGDLLNNSGASMNFSHNTALGVTVGTFGVQSLSTNVNRLEFSGFLMLHAISTTSQVLGFNVPHSTAVGSNYGAHSFTWAGSMVMSEDTSTDKVLEWRFKMGTAAALGEMLAKVGTVTVFKATG